MPGVGPVDGYADGRRCVVELVLSEETPDRTIEKLAAVDAQRPLMVRDGAGKRRALARLDGLARVEVVKVQELVQLSA